MLDYHRGFNSGNNLPLHGPMVNIQIKDYVDDTGGQSINREDQTNEKEPKWR